MVARPARTASTSWWRPLAAGTAGHSADQWQAAQVLVGALHEVRDGEGERIGEEHRVTSELHRTGGRPDRRNAVSSSRAADMLR
ncbi:MAG: hypothetical protein WCF33_02105 [Pseudonocardiaceae bacterium]